MADNQDKAFVDYVVKAIVDNPDQVSSERTVDEMGVLITLKVAPEDLGQVIGRNGQTAKSIRTLLRVVGAKNHARVNLKIYEPEDSRRSRPPRPDRSERSERPAPAEDDASTAIDDLNL
ncbi:MAG: KH domain-containing protein [Patescibacteria group bacterium]